MNERNQFGSVLQCNQWNFPHKHAKEHVLTAEMDQKVIVDQQLPRTDVIYIKGHDDYLKYSSR